MTNGTDEIGLLVTLPNKTIQIKQNRVYKKLHSLDLLEKRLEVFREAFRKKYYCDYIAVHLFNKNNDIFFSNVPHDAWHNYYWQHHMNGCNSLKMSSQLTKGKNGFLFFFDYGNNRALSVRSEIVGEAKDGFTIMFHNDVNGNKIQFSVTFQDSKGISSFDSSSFKQFLTDLKKAETVIDDFIEYFDTHGSLENNKELATFVNNQKYFVPI